MMPSLSRSRWGRERPLDQVGARRQRAELDVVDQRRLGAVDGIAQGRDQHGVGQHLFDALGHDRGLMTPEHVAGRRLADGELARPSLELPAVPLGSVLAEVLGAVEELQTRAAR